jgi:hypothetical protein
MSIRCARHASTIRMSCRSVAWLVPALAFGPARRLEDLADRHLSVPGGAGANRLPRSRRGVVQVYGGHLRALTKRRARGHLEPGRQHRPANDGLFRVLCLEVLAEPIDSPPAPLCGGFQIGGVVRAFDFHQPLGLPGTGEGCADRVGWGDRVTLS